MVNAKPNLFEYATGELSQDAFIAWLLAWADPKHRMQDSALHKCAKELVCALLKKHGVKFGNDDITNVSTGTQEHRVDIFCQVNDKFDIVIEDKLSGGDSKEKLEATLAYFIQQTGGNLDKTVPIYFKTHNENDTGYVSKAGFKIFDRKEFLEILNKHETENAIYTDYKVYLQKIDDDYDSYKNTDLQKWTDCAWIGFYSELKKQIKVGDWAYSANQQGGHYVFWWQVLQIEGGDIYCQIDSTHMNARNNAGGDDNYLQVRIGAKENTHRSEFRDNCYEKARSIYNKKAEKHSLYAVEKPARFGTGRSMKILCAIGDIFVFEDDVINLSMSAKNLNDFSAVLYDVQKELQ